jgi:hypothetical protein
VTGSVTRVAAATGSSPKVHQPSAHRPLARRETRLANRPDYEGREDEDQAALGKVWHYDPTSDALTQIAEHDPALFTPGSPDFITQDEETSGVIDVSNILGEGWYLLDDQVHAASADPELVEGGQLLAMHLPPGKFPQK